MSEIQFFNPNESEMLIDDMLCRQDDVKTPQISFFFETGEFVIVIDPFNLNDMQVEDLIEREFNKEEGHDVDISGLAFIMARKPVSEHEKACFMKFTLPRAVDFAFDLIDKFSNGCLSQHIEKKNLVANVKH